ncbi:MAG: transposase [Kiritimatiellae bacterium]|nr:transposase [Kiritimatiellia bacterium]
MARTARVKSNGEGTAYYHLVSRASNKQFLFRKSAAKDRLAELARKAAEFSGIKLVAFAVMDNHYHILCKVTRSCDPVPQEEVVRRVGILKGTKAAEFLAEHWRELAAAGFDATLESELNRYRARMNDISEFMKTMKELYAIWYNREYDYCGSIWSGVFKSTMVEGGRYLEYCRRYIMMNPVRAGIVSQMKDYRWVWGADLEETEGFAGCLPEWSVMERVAQVGAGKIFGSEAFVRKWIYGLGDKFLAARTAAHAVGSIGFSSHGWRLANKDVLILCGKSAAQRGIVL